MSALSSTADIHQADGNVSWCRQQATLREPLARAWPNTDAPPIFHGLGVAG